jgi:hypothetical protein
MKVQGTQEQKPLDLEFGKDAVYRRSNITKCHDDEKGDYWEYDEEQYTLQEYVQILHNEKEQGEGEIKLALTELAEAVLGR